MPEETPFPANWLIGQDFDPNKHMTQLGRYDKKAQKWVYNDYLNVQNRLLWFIRDQRNLIAAGLAKCPYTIQTDLVELDRERGWAHYKTYIRDVMGNEATMYGSEAAASFPDYAEKASTKSLGRSLLLLGYGTNTAPELDEGDRVVDAPTEAQAQAAAPAQYDAKPKEAGAVATAKQQSTQPLTRGQIEKWLATQGFATSSARVDVMRDAGLSWGEDVYADADFSLLRAYVNEHPMPASDKQLTSIGLLCQKLGRAAPTDPLTFAGARDLITQLSRAYSEVRQTA